MNKQAMRNSARTILICMIGGIIYLSVILFVQANETSTTEPSEEVIKLDEIHSLNMSAGVDKILNGIDFIDIKDIEKKQELPKKELENSVKNEKHYKYYKIIDNGHQTSMDKELQKYTYDLCVEYGIEDYYTLILCQLYKESTYIENLISKTNDYGIAQINVCNHGWLSKKLGVTDFLDARQSILCNIYLMSDYIEKYGVESALVCYNTGKPYSSNSYAREVINLWNNCIVEETN